MAAEFLQIVENYVAENYGEGGKKRLGQAAKIIPIRQA